jgi:hypothetical protein
MRMSIITKSYAPDFEMCADLYRSVLNYAPEMTHHHIIVPGSDLKLFNKLVGPRTHIHCDTEFLPKSFIALPLGNFIINPRRPIPPVRGWILQQLIKLAAVATSEDDVVLVVDSDVEFIRPFTADIFIRNGVVRFYRKPKAIDASMPRHIAWQRIARTMLGLAPASSPPYTDYISAMIACDPKIVRRMLAQVTATTGRHWATSIASQLHFSEWILYGVFVDEALGLPTNPFVSDDPLCRAYWNDGPLSEHAAIDFLNSVQPTDVAAMISGASRTPLAYRRAAFTKYRADQNSSAKGTSPAQ